jgi:hypothetical protein
MSTPSQEAIRRRRRRLKKIRFAHELIEGAILILRNQGDAAVANEVFHQFYYLLRLAMKAP